MDQVDAYRLLDDKARAWQETSFTELVSRLGQTVSEHVKWSGQTYLVESTFLQDSDDRQAIRIDLMVAIAGTGPLRRIDRTILIQPD